MNKRSLLIMFVKDPVLGEVKTRLASSLDDSFTVELYKSFVQDLIQEFNHQAFDFKLYGNKNLDRISVEFDYPMIELQAMGDLGCKMYQALYDEFLLGYEQIILIGSDLPQLSYTMIEEALDQLKTNDAVIGPSEDGGYYLIGFNQGVLDPKFFNGIHWSTHTVLEETLSRMERYRVNILDYYNDIDTLEDLTMWYAQYKEERNQSHTIRYLKDHKQWNSLTL